MYVDEVEQVLGWAEPDEEALPSEVAAIRAEIHENALRALMHQGVAIYRRPVGRPPSGLYDEAGVSR